METISNGEQLRVGIVGLGKIGRAALEQWQAAGYEVNGVGRSDDWDVLNSADVIALTVEPQALDEAGSRLREHLTDRHIVLSFLAGKTVCELSEVLGTSRVGRTMTNYNLLVGQAMTAWYVAEGVLAREEDAVVVSLLGCLGKTMRLTNENMFNSYTAKGAGSMPAILAHVVALTEQSMHEDGFSEEDARLIALQTIKGTVATLESGIRSQDVEGRVATRGGATWKIFEALKEYGWDERLLLALEAGRLRCEELGRKG